MQTMRAMRLNSNPDGKKLAASTMPVPAPGSGEILVRVRASGVTPTELQWYPTTHTKEGSIRSGAVPGHEFSGTVEAVGEGLADFTVGDEIFGLNDWFADGAAADFCITTPAMVARKPAKLSHIEAATVPIGALTAWQGLVDKGQLQSRQRVLIHGGAGAVGLFAVQVARQRGAYVIATASTRTLGFVRDLGANEVLDYAACRFEEKVRDIDLVFDTVGGETRARSWQVLGEGGAMVTIAADAEATDDARIKEAFLLVRADSVQLAHIARLLDTGDLKAFVKGVVPFEEASAAYEGNLAGQLGYGKTVLALSK
jgi:NADPH:quinone reductase-like Zn-dependent oxidoreductase